MSETPAAPAQLAHLLSYILINREAELMVTVVLNKLGTPVRLSYRKGDSRARPRTTACASQCRLTSTARRGGASRSNCSCPSLRSGRTLDKGPVYVFAGGLRIEHFPGAIPGPRQAIEAYPLPGAAMALTD
jgi:hypothetical protein